MLDGAEANYGDDTDGDGMINPLDPDSDNDGITDGTEVGVTTPHPDTDTTAGHFTPDADPATHTSMVVTDTDHGGVPDGEEDTDHDGQVDAGERDPLDPADDQPLDRDHDGVLDVVDNCPDTANPDQDDPDHDGLGSACDDDDDGDGFVDGYGVSGGGCSTSGGQGGGGLAVLALAVAGVIVRRRRRVAAAATVAGLTALVPVAAAQVASEKQDFSIERFELSSDTGGILGVEGAGLGARWAWDVHLWLGSANDPLVVYMDDGGRERVGSLISQRTGGELGASLVLHERIGLGLDAPLIVAQSRDAMVPGVVGTLGDVGGVGLGDLRISPKLRLLRQGHEGVDVALVPELTLPTGAGENYRGDDGASFAPYLALSRRHARVRWALDLGYAFRRQTGVGGLVVDDELRAKAGVGVQVVRRVELAATVSAATAAKAPFDDFARNHLEVVGGPVASLRGGWQLFGAGGVGLRQGYGTPDWRALAGVRVGVGDDGGPVDWDHDGLIATDQCPRDPEDKDGFQDADGCSDPDNDSDGVLDVADGAPMDPEDKDDFRPFRGSVFKTKVLNSDGAVQDKHDLVIYDVDGIKYFLTEFQNSDQFVFDVNADQELLVRPFNVARGVNIAPGDFDFTSVSTSYAFGQQRRASGTVGVRVGQFYNGRLTAYTLSGARLRGQVGTDGDALAAVDQDLAIVDWRRRHRVDFRAGEQGGGGGGGGDQGCKGERNCDERSWRARGQERTRARQRLGGSKTEEWTDARRSVSGQRLPTFINCTGSFVP